MLKMKTDYNQADIFTGHLLSGLTLVQCLSQDHLLSNVMSHLLAFSHLSQ